MKTFIRNFSHTFRRFLSASLLNIVGLSLAFASFFVIMTQVDYDYSFNKGYKDYDKIFRVEFDGNKSGAWQNNLPRPLGKVIETSSSHVEAISTILSWSDNSDYEVNGHLFNETFTAGFGDFIDTFQPEMLCGSTQALEQQGQILISQSMALRFFDTTDVVGKIIFDGKQANKKPLTIGGVYKDFPANTQFGNSIFCALPDADNQNAWNTYNYHIYVRISSTQEKEGIEKAVCKKLVELNPFYNITLQGEQFIRLTPLSEVHFSTVGNKSASSRTTLYLLCCVSFLIIVIAAINFMNFSLAETPMRIRSINTQKVLGATVRSLRISLIGESGAISLIAFGLSLVLLLALQDSGIQDLVTADLTLTKHPFLLITTGAISVLMGALAGIYPSYYVTSFPPALALKGSFGLSPKGKSLRTGLVALQFFVSFMLIIAIGIMYVQSNYIRTSDYGYNKDAIVVGRISKEDMSRAEAIAEELSRIPGVENVALSQFSLNSSDSYMSFGMGQEEKQMNFEVFPIDEHFLKTTGIRITDGRNFKNTDGCEFIFNEAARQMYPWLTLGEPPIKNGGLPYPVVGFCENIKFSTFRNDDTTRPMAFLYGNETWTQKRFVNIRIAAGTDRIEIIRSLQKAMEKFTPGHDFNFRFMDEVIDEAYHNELRFTRQILLFSLLAIAISIIGVFGLTMFESEYRRKEIGIRKIMGSSTAEILYMFNRRYLTLLGGCFLVAAPFGWWIGSNWLEGFVEKTSISPWIFLIAFLLVTLITMITVTLQSWKNANENPAYSIKTE